MTFRVGQKVVCVDARGSDNLTDRAIYTIKDILPEELRYWRGGYRNAIGICLEETRPNPDSFSFAPERFRPIVERKTDISIFTAMLTPEKIGASA